MGTAPPPPNGLTFLSRSLRPPPTQPSLLVLLSLAFILGHFSFFFFLSFFPFKFFFFFFSFFFLPFPVFPFDFLVIFFFFPVLVFCCGGGCFSCLVLFLLLTFLVLFPPSPPPHFPTPKMSLRMLQEVGARSRNRNGGRELMGLQPEWVSLEGTWAERSPASWI